MKQEAFSGNGARPGYPAGFVPLTDAIPDALLDIRYYSGDNFVGERIDGYEEPTALLTKEAAAALKEAAAEFARLGYRIKVFDAYRPQQAVDRFVRWAADETDTRMKPVYYPGVDKRELIPQGYIAPRSAHSRGSTVDLTLYDAAEGRELDMGGPFDFFGPLSHPDCPDVAPSQFQNRMLLRDVMRRHCFLPLAEEWWHFTLRDEPYPDTYFDFPVVGRPPHQTGKV